MDIVISFNSRESHWGSAASAVSHETQNLARPKRKLQAPGEYQGRRTTRTAIHAEINSNIVPTDENGRMGLVLLQRGNHKHRDRRRLCFHYHTWWIIIFVSLAAGRAKEKRGGRNGKGRSPPPTWLPRIHVKN